MDAYLLFAICTSPKPGETPTFLTLLTHRLGGEIPSDDALDRWTVEQLSKGYELGLYSSSHVRLSGDGDEWVCHREELLLWDGSSVMVREIRVFQREARVETPYATGSSF